VQVTRPCGTFIFQTFVIFPVLRAPHSTPAPIEAKFRVSEFSYMQVFHC